MHQRKRGLAAALLCVMLFVSGCSGRSGLVVSSLETELVCGGSSRPGMESEAGSQADAQTEAGEKETQQIPLGYVYICGAVHNPGVYPVTEDMRVFEVVELAGGFVQGADKQWLNLASQVQDGQQIYVYTCAETQGMKQADVSGAGMGGQAGLEEADGLVNLNTASREELMTLPGIGEAKADAIIRYRTECGGFEAPEDIMQISGIKEAVFSNIKDYITVQ